MSRKRHGAILLPWLSAKVNNHEKRFLQIGNSLLLSPDFQALTYGAQILYFCMCMEAGGKRKVLFFRGTAKKYGISKNVYLRQVHELLDTGFIAVVSEGSYHRFTPTCYTFNLEWKGISLPSNRGQV